MTDKTLEARTTDVRPRPDASKESWLLRTGLSLSVWSLAGVATILAATGQVEFARWAGITDLRAYAVPAVLELVAVAFLLIGYRRARRGDSASMLWLLAAVVGGFAVYTNVVHTGGRSGLVFGAASAITLLLWFVKLRDDYRHFQRQTGQATRPRPKLGALWLVAPRLSTRAWVVATRRRISTVDEAVGYAEVWRAVYEDSRTARVGRRLARRTAWQSVAAVAGGVYAELPRTAEIAAVQVLKRDTSHSDAVGTHEARTAVGPAPAAPQQHPSNSRSPLPAVPATAVGTRPALSAAAVRDRVYTFLDSQVGVEDYTDVGDGDDPYLQWLTAQGLGLDVEVVAPHVREWCQQAVARHDPYLSDTRPFDPWPAEQQFIPPNHRAGRP
jgi:Protein of unknown function (DUF2637)